MDGKLAGLLMENDTENNNIGTEKINNNVNKNKKNMGCLWTFIILVLIGSIAALLDDGTTSTPQTTSDNTSYTSENYQTEGAYRPVTGKYSGFGGMNVAFSNWGGQSANCLENGAGKSLVSQIEVMFQERKKKKNQVLYSISNYNPTLKFEVNNPRWAEVAEDFDRCIADITFKNYKPDTIAGYKGYGDSATPYTIDEAQFGVTYYVSKRGDKYKASIRAVGCDPIEGYYN